MRQKKTVDHIELHGGINNASLALFKYPFHFPFLHGMPLLAFTRSGLADGNL